MLPKKRITGWSATSATGGRVGMTLGSVASVLRDPCEWQRRSKDFNSSGLLNNTRNGWRAIWRSNRSSLSFSNRNQRFLNDGCCCHVSATNREDTMSRSMTTAGPAGCAAARRNRFQGE